MDNLKNKYAIDAKGDLAGKFLSEQVTVFTPGRTQGRRLLQQWCAASFHNFTRDEKNQLDMAYDAWGRIWPQICFNYEDGRSGITLIADGAIEDTRLGVHIVRDKYSHLQGSLIKLKHSGQQAISVKRLVWPGKAEHNCPVKVRKNTEVENIFHNMHPSTFFKGINGATESLISCIAKRSAGPLRSRFGKLTPVKQDEFAALARRISLMQRKATLRYFASLLDAHALETLIVGRHNYLPTYNWIRIAKTSEQTLRRRRFATTYPLLQKLAVQSEPLTHAIDTGEQVSRVIGETLQIAVKPATIRALAKRNGAQVPAEMLQDIKYYLPQLDVVPFEWWPQDRMGWQAYLHHRDVALSFSKVSGRPYGQILKESQGNWDALKRDGSTAKHAEEAGDYVASVFRKVVAPFVVRAAAEHNFSSGIWISSLSTAKGMHEAWKLFSSRHMREIIRFSVVWHQRIDELQERGKSLELPDNTSWQGLTREVVAPNGVTLTPLTTAGALRAEGAKTETGMWHCVGSYAAYCVSGTYHIYHLSSPDNPRLSTLTFAHEFENGKRKIWQVQHKSVLNAKPNSTAQQAADWLMEEINTGRMPVDWGSIVQQRDLNRSTSAIGYNPFDLDKHEMAYTILRPVLPSTTQATTLEMWARRMQIPAYVKQTLATMPKLDL